jgi:hypothetical protein
MFRFALGIVGCVALGCVTAVWVVHVVATGAH